MTKIVEERHENETGLIGWLMWKIGNLLAIDSDSVFSLFAVAWGFKEDGKWCWTPRSCEDKSLFYNAMLFLRVTVPFGIFWQVRWSGSDSEKAFANGSLGCKLNGRITFGPGIILSPVAFYFAYGFGMSLAGVGLALLGCLLMFALRRNSDSKSAQGVSGPNLGQATGWNFGTH